MNTKLILLLITIFLFTSPLITSCSSRGDKDNSPTPTLTPDTVTPDTSTTNFTPTMTPSQTTSITATVTPVLGSSPSVETGTSVVHFSNLVTITNEVEMRLERFDIMPSSVMAYLCFDKPSNRYTPVNWTTGQASLQIGRASGEMKTSTLLFDANEHYIAENFIPAFGSTDRNNRCEKLTFQFEQPDGLRGLAAGLDTSIEFTLSVLNLRKIDNEFDLFDGPWIFSLVLNP